MNNNYRYRILTSLVALMAIMGAEAQTAPEVPRLVVNIIIDQLRADYMEAFSPLYGDGGFRRLLQEGRVYQQAEYPFADPDRASAVACMMSGACPYDNGIVGERWLNRQTLRPQYCVDDDKFRGNLTAEASSPENLAVSTIGDELKIATDGKGLVYSVAPFRDAAILSAGHAADCAFWINDLTGQWCSTSYYGTYPQWAVNYDTYSSLRSRIGAMSWIPSNELVGNFNYFVSGGMRSPFSHSFKGDRKFREFKASALVNEEVSRFAMYCMQNTLMGVDAVTDILNVTYYAGNYDHKSVTECPMELQDTYVRLDQTLATLMDDIEKKIGRDKVLFVVTSTGYTDSHYTGNLSKYRVPTGTFSITKAQMLLNMYLIAVYGQGNYVEQCMDNELYLNLKLIEQRNLNLTEVLERSSAFLIQMAGVKDVYTSERLALGAWTPGISRLRNAYNPKTSGDILIQVAPGWTLLNETTYEKQLSRESYMGFPLIFLGSNIQSEKIVTPVTIDMVAPTIAQTLRIRAPNGCAQRPL